MKRLLLAGAVLAALAAPVMAAEVVVPGVPAVESQPAFSWTGAFVGAFGGYGFGYSSATGSAVGIGGDEDLGAFDEGALGLTFDLTPRGVLGGITVGYNRQTGAIVVGGAAAGGFLSLSDALTIDTANVAGVLDDDEGAVGYGWYATLTGRIGVALDRTLLFATAGGIITQFAASYADLDGAATDDSDETLLVGPQYGYLLGGGAEFAFDSNWTALLEYNFFNLGSDTTTNDDGDEFTLRNRAHLVRFGLNFLFNGY